MFKRGQNTTPTLVARNALSNLPMCASLKTPSQKPNGKKEHGEKSTHNVGFTYTDFSYFAFKCW
jgi:hypothetical protein